MLFSPLGPSNIPKFSPSENPSLFITCSHRTGGPILTIYTSYDVFPKDVSLGGFVDMPPHLGGQMHQNPKFREEKCRFPAKLVKSKNIHIIKTTASISTKFCTVIKTTRLVAWLEFNIPFQHKYSYIRDQIKAAFIKSHTA